MHLQKPALSLGLRAFLAFALALAVVALPGSASAESIIKRPGDHPKYSVELDPHLVIGWGGWSPGPFDDEGFGVGFRASIPIVEQGPIKKINNSMAIGFGGDMLFYSDDDCGYGRWNRFDYRYDCSGGSLVFPVVLQWNFWLTDVISVFGEPGLAVRHSWINVEYPCDNNLLDTCDADDSDTDFVPFIFWAGGRFLFSDSVGLTVRLGWPYIGVGASILL
jgi:hypothetical protein